MTARTWSIREVLEAAEGVAAQRASGPSRSDMARALADVLGVDRLRLLLDHDRPLSEAERDAFRARLARLLDGEPLAYVLGRQEFYSRSFRVDASVLVPRPETELLVELAVARLPEGAAVFEPCTGSGCVAVSLALERADLRVSASDVSGDALSIARHNARELGARVGFAAGSFWGPAAGRAFDALVANPPYVDPDKPELLDGNVRRYEPAVALFTPRGDPLHSYKELLRGGVSGLRSGSWVLLEVGIDTAEGALGLVAGSRSYHEGELVPDLAGHPRVLACRRR